MCTSKPSEINTMPTYMNSHDPTVWLIKVRSRSHNFLAFDGDLDVLNLPLFAMSRALQDRVSPCLQIVHVRSFIMIDRPFETNFEVSKAV